MATFDRFDICEAYAALEIDWNVGGILQERRRSYSVGVQLHRIGFKSGPMFSGWESLTPNAREIYNEACKRLRLGDGGYKDCACRDCSETAIGWGRPFCSECEEAGCEPNQECQAPGAYKRDEEDGPEPEEDDDAFNPESDEGDRE